MAKGHTAAAATTIARLPSYSHIFSYIKELLHWLRISTRIECKILSLRHKLGVAPKHLRDTIQPPTSASSRRPLCSMDRREIFVPRTNITMAKSRSFSIIGPSLLNRHPSTSSQDFLLCLTPSLGNKILVSESPMGNYLKA